MIPGRTSRLTKRRNPPWPRNDTPELAVRVPARQPTFPTCLTCLASGIVPRPGVSSNPLQITYVSHLIEDGVDPLFVQHQVGHSWASTTAGYTTVGADHTNRMLRAALEQAFGKEERS